MSLFGASGHAKVIMDIIAAQGDNVGKLYDDNPHCRQLKNRPVLFAPEARVEGPMIISIGSNEIRKRISGRYPLQYAKAVHPSAIVSPSASVGSGSVVMQGAIIQADARVGKHCIINTGASVDHECVIDDFVHISPHATLCGNVHVGEGSWIGAATTIIPGIRIGKWCTIGAGSVVVKDVPDGSTAYGDPCRIID
ncbi:MAG: acetyltransferase [Muribaculaceae bacterium]|nr:acetyltransferase [Muribaculaceae bacterium]MDE7335526.1 acetyltransferase [Muribaculaceae bacterium]